MADMQMGGLQWVLDIALIGLLAATLFHATRLERALRLLKRDRTELEELVRHVDAIAEIPNSLRLGTRVELTAARIDRAG